MAEPRDQVLVRMTPTLLRLIDEWRRQQPEIPTRAQALRHLANIGLGVEQKRAQSEAKSDERRRQRQKRRPLEDIL